MQPHTPTPQQTKNEHELHTFSAIIEFVEDQWLARRVENGQIFDVLWRSTRCFLLETLEELALLREEDAGHSTNGVLSPLPFSLLFSRHASLPKSTKKNGYRPTSDAAVDLTEKSKTLNRLRVVAAPAQLGKDITPNNPTTLKAFVPRKRTKSHGA
ncbi:hypothetical protein AX14_002460 [Amanita brunnescens Koide BX004]|nr:hypothetical protein AX14_002460 [Amanita brunnescens Koide BX004]